MNQGVRHTDPNCLIAAVKNEQIEEIHALITSGTDINVIDQEGASALIHAIRLENIGIVKMLLDAKINLYYIYRHYIPLAYAIIQKHPNIEIIRLLANADKELLNIDCCYLSLFDSVPPLHFAINKTDNSKILKVLIQAGASTETLAENLMTCLHYAIWQQKTDMVKTLIKQGANIEALHEYKLNVGNYVVMTTPLAHALKYGLSEIVKVLIAAGANIEDIGYGMTCLQYMIKYYNYYESQYTLIAQALIDKGTNVEALYDDNQMTCLHRAIINDRINMVEILLANGANKEARYNGMTPLYLAISYKNIEIAKILIKAGANITFPFEFLLKILPKIITKGLTQDLLSDCLTQYPCDQHEITDPQLGALASRENNLLLHQAQKEALKNPKLFQPIVDMLLKIERVQARELEIMLQVKSLYNNEIAPNTICDGPLEKNLFTQELEWIAKYALRNPTHCHFFEKKNALHVTLKDTTINLSILIKNANLSHILLDNHDSALFLSDNLPELREDYTLTNKFITASERAAINDYTGNIDYKSINSILYGNPPEGVTSAPDFYRNTFFKIVFMASGLNKIKPSWSRDPECPAPPIKTYRGEKHLTPEEFSQRQLKLQHTPQCFIQKQSGFTSTSTSLKTANKFSDKYSLMVYHDQYGKDIAPLSRVDEDEYLMFPGYVCISKIEKNDKLTIFNARAFVPLFKTHRAVNQEYRFYHLKQEKNLTPAFLSGLLEECQFAYDHYLSKAYTEDWYKEDWALDTDKGVIPRPNHGLAHTMRVAQLVSVVAEFLNNTNFTTFTTRDIHIVQLTAIFSVVGRKNDAGFQDMQAGKQGAYKAYKQTSSEAFSDYVTNHTFLNMNAAEISEYSRNILNMGEPDENSTSAILLALAHKLDLLRCFTPVGDSLNTHIINPLKQYLGESATYTLIEYAEKLLHATGDRVLCGNQKAGYHHAIFYPVSTDVNACFYAIESVPVPDVPEPMPPTHKKALIV